MRHQSISTLPENFWKRVDRSGECWLWLRYVNRWGYGRLYWDGRMQLAHRVAWQLTNGKITDGLLVLHDCDNPLCCNPAHLRLGTNADNIADMVQKGRAQRRLGMSHHMAKLTDDDVHEIRRRFAYGGVSLASLGREFGVTPQMIGHIVRRSNWTHI